MSSGPLPPVPDLIPIAALLKNPSGNNNSRARRECAPCTTHSEVMGEQRSRRTGNQPSVDLIDSAQSRGPSAAPQAPQSRKARSERHRKSDRRREHRKPARTRSGSKHSSKSREPSTPVSSPERPANPRVNPIFVWVRQEDTRIVDVKCEDYDKRNRILLTKTAQGWRAIPRTETLVPTLKEAADNHHQHHHHHHHRNRKSRKSKVRRKSAAVQVDSDIQDLDQDDDRPPSPTWTSPVNVESHLPSHKIHVPKKCPSPTDSPSVNSVVTESAQTQSEKCSVAKICDVSPLDNLLAVAEFEFNQHMQSGEWNNKTPENNHNNKSFDEIDDDQKEFINNMEQLNSLIESCSKNENKISADSNNGDFNNQEPKTEDCDYTEDDDNNLAMDDILSRLEQSLRSPECNEITEVLNDCSPNYDETKIEEDIKEAECFPSDINENNYKSVPDELENYFEENKTPEEKEAKSSDLNSKITEEPSEEIVESSTTNEDEPTDLSIKPKYDDNECNNITINDDPEQPTDLTVPKNPIVSSPVRSSTPRPPSQNSEAIQSPQPSGIPAVPPSPDIVSTSANNCKNKSVFLESLLTTTSQKIALNSEVTIIKQKEPLDLGKCRKSASPTVTCSEEVKNSSDSEPPNKKFKSEDITLKNLLDVEAAKSEAESKLPEKVNPPETPRLLELLKTDSGPDPLTQLRQILYDTNLNVPDPMLVPKERLSQIISNPGREIPRLLKQRPELRLPEALAFPHLLQDPDILVITLQQLETIILKQNQSFSLKDIKNSQQDKNPEKVSKPMEKCSEPSKENHTKKKSLNESVAKLMSTVQESQPKSGFNELANDIDAATTAAFNQMIWLPYLNQLEAMSFGGNPDVLKMLTNSFPMYTGQIPDLNHLIGANRFPPPVNFPLQQPQLNYNSLELSMWQEAMMQANVLRPKIPFEGLNPKNSFRDYLDKLNFAASAKTPNLNNHKLPNMLNKPNLPNNFFPSGTNGHAPYQNSFLNIPNTFQSNNSKQNLQIPHYNPLFNQKNLIGQQKPSSHPYLHKQKFEPKPNFSNFYHQRNEDKQQKQEHKAKVSCKPFANVTYQKHSSEPKEKSSSNADFSKLHTQPIDLSGSTAPTAKLKVKQHLVDPVNASKLLKHDDVPEVGSTTVSVEEMQDAHKHLWHPLFGNQKGYHSPWNWTTVTATGE